MILAALATGEFGVAAAIVAGALGILGVALLRPRRSLAVVALNGALAIVLLGGILSIEQLPFGGSAWASHLVTAGGAAVVVAALLALHEARQSDAAARAASADTEAQRRSIETLGAANVRLEDELRGARAKLSAAGRPAEESDASRSSSAHRARQALDAAQALERKHRAVFDGAVEGMAMLERETLKVIEANASLERLTGFAKAELFERTIFQLFGEGPGRPAKADLQRAGRERRALAGTLLRKDGSPLHVEVTLTVVGSDAEPQLLAVLRDVSGRDAADRDSEEQVAALRERERRLQGAVKALETRVETVEGEAARLRAVAAEKDHVVAIVSHELRTPLTSIASFSEILLDHPEVETAVRDEFLGIIHKESARLTRLVNDVLDLARIEAGAMRLERTEFDARGVIGDAVGSVSGAAAQSDVSIVSNTGTVPRILHADRDRIQQLLVNLLANAVKFSPRGSEVRIDLNDDADPSRVEITVADEGPGIAPDDLDRVFEKFGRAADAAARGVDGTGLGLAICRELATQHGGTISVDSAPGRGSRFTLCLPAAGEARRAAPGRPKAAAPVVESSTQIPVLTPVTGGAADPPRAKRREPAPQRRKAPPLEPAHRGGGSGGHAWSTTGSLPPLASPLRTSRRDTNSTTGELPPIR